MSLASARDVERTLRTWLDLSKDEEAEPVNKNETAWSRV